MALISRYKEVLFHVSRRKAMLHALGRTLVTVSIGVFFWRELEQYSGLMLIVGVILMLPVLGVVLKERGLRKRKKGKKR